MKNNNLWRIIWIVGIYAVLVLILYLVILYKVKWENKDLNRYLYIYDCNDSICTTDNKVTPYIASILCENDVCPYIKEKRENILMIYGKTKEYIFDLKSNQIISDSYNNYAFSQNDDIYIASKNNLYGVIDKGGNILVDFTYDKIIDYKDGFVLYEKNGKYGIDNPSTGIKIAADYDKLILISGSLYGYFKDNEYFIASYISEEPVNNSIYDYIYAYKDVLLVSKNNQIDILDTNLKSKLIMKINTYFPYTKEQERATLKPKGSGNTLKFSIYTDDDNYTEYIYDLKASKLYNQK